MFVSVLPHVLELILTVTPYSSFKCQVLDKPFPSTAS